MFELRQLLVAINLDFIFLCETKINANEFEPIHMKCNLDGCFVVDPIGYRMDLLSSGMKRQYLHPIFLS